MHAQRTLRRPISCTGIGLHSGNKATLSLKPAPANFGIRFRRTDLGGVEIPATVEHLADHLPSGRLDKLLLISDCMSPVGGFEAQAADFLATMQIGRAHV